MGKEDVAYWDAELCRERERAKEWEGLAASRLAELEEARRELAAFRADAGQRLAAVLQDEQEMLKGLGVKRDDDRSLIEKAAIARGAQMQAEQRITLLEKSLRFIERVDKTPRYGCKGTRADRDRHGQLPKKAGTRWKSPREIVRELKLPAE